MQGNGSPGCKAGTGGNARDHRLRMACLCLLAGAGVILHAACTTPSQPPPTANAGGPVQYIVKADTTPFFEYGPAQSKGPDMQLKKDTMVTMVEKRYGYSRVMGPDGQSGYVPTDDIAPAPVQPSATPAPKRSGGGGSPRRGGGTPNFEQPNDAALPSKQPPVDTPAPSFRY